MCCSYLLQSLNYIWLQSIHTHMCDYDWRGGERVFMCSIKILKVMIWSCWSSCCCCCCCRLLFPTTDDVLLTQENISHQSLLKLFDEISMNINFSKIMFSTTSKLKYFETLENNIFNNTSNDNFSKNYANLSVELFKRFEQTCRTVLPKSEMDKRKNTLQYFVWAFCLSWFIIMSNLIATVFC